MGDEADVGWRCSIDWSDELFQTAWIFRNKRLMLAIGNARDSVVRNDLQEQRNQSILSGLGHRRVAKNSYFIKGLNSMTLSWTLYVACTFIK
jgi:hypothetical protein